MEELWQKIAKEKGDGKKYIFLKGGAGDLGFLYVSGFVDISKYGFKEWFDSFADSRQKDGTFLVTHEQWLAKKKFRYEGKIGPPFDPMAIPEKEYTEAEVVKLLTEKVIPNTIFSPAYIPQYLNDLRAQKRLVNGKMVIDRAAKEIMTRTINTYPSPLRLLELMVAAFKDQRTKKFQSSQLAAQKSSFAAGSTAEKIIRGRLAEIAQAEKAAEQTPPEESTLSLKDLRKKSPTGGRV